MTLGEPIPIENVHKFLGHKMLLLFYGHKLYFYILIARNHTIIKNELSSSGIECILLEWSIASFGYLQYFFVHFDRLVIL